MNTAALATDHHHSTRCFWDHEHARWVCVREAERPPVDVRDMLVVHTAYEGDPEVLATMLASAPAVPRMVVPRIEPRIYARRAARVHGTSRPSSDS